MTVADFMSLVAESETKTGSRPRVVRVSPVDINAIQGELEATTVWAETPVVAASTPTDATIFTPKRTPLPGYMMTICGVDVCRDVNVQAGHIYVDRSHAGDAA